jgi:hypothetical protein
MLLPASLHWTLWLVAFPYDCQADIPEVFAAVLISPCKGRTFHNRSIRDRSLCQERSLAGGVLLALGLTSGFPLTSAAGSRRATIMPIKRYSATPSRTEQIYLRKKPLHAPAGLITEHQGSDSFDLGLGTASLRLSGETNIGLRNSRLCLVGPLFGTFDRYERSIMAKMVRAAWTTC